MSTPEPTAAEVMAEIERDASRAAAAEARRQSARGPHIRPAAAGRLSEPTGPDPRGRHVKCEHCKRLPGQACQHPTRQTPPGFVHPCRVEAEAAWWEGVASAPVTG